MRLLQEQWHPDVIRLDGLGASLEMYKLNSVML